MPFAPFGSRRSTARGDDRRSRRAQLLAARRSDRVQINAVEIIARLFRRDRELRAVDQRFSRRRRARSECVISPAARSGKSLSGRVCSVKRERPARMAARRGRRRLRARSASHRAACARCRRTYARARWSSRRWRPSPAAVSVTSRSRSVAFRLRRDLLGAQKHVAEDRNRVPAFDHAVDVAQRFRELRALDGNLHDTSARSQVRKLDWRPGGGRAPRRLDPRPDKRYFAAPRGPQGDAMRSQIQGSQAAIRRPCPSLLRRFRGWPPALIPEAGASGVRPRRTV
jgi:hypothetical protein